MRQGFTLIELTFVIAILGVLTALTVPTFQALYRQSQTSEAQAMLNAIAHAELRHHRDTGAFLPCGPSGPVKRAPAPLPAEQRCWDALLVRTGGDLRYRYEVRVDGDRFEVRALGDLDGDGKPGLWTLDGQTLHIGSVEGLE